VNIVEEKENFQKVNVQFVKEEKPFMKIRISKSQLKKELRMEMRLFLEEKEMPLKLPYLEMWLYKSKFKNIRDLKEEERIYMPK
jgi:hypothetical protein